MTRTPHSQVNYIPDISPTHRAPVANSLCYADGLSCGEESSFVWVADSFLARDSLAHEFGHGFAAHPGIRIDLARRGDYQVEHIADTIAILTHAALDPVLAPDPRYWMDTNLPSGTPIRRHDVLGCTGYEPGAMCDAVTITVPENGFTSEQGCREYTHMSFLANFNEIGEPHANSCINSRIPYLLLQSGGPISQHGVDVPGGLSRELVSAFFRTLFTQHMTPISNQYWQYAPEYRDAIDAIVAKCAVGIADVPECEVPFSLDAPRAENLRRSLADPLWAQGFWSDETALMDVTSGVAPTAVVAPPAGADPGGVYLLHTQPTTGDLRVKILTDPRAGTGPAPFSVADRLAGGTRPTSFEQPAAVIGIDGLLRVVYVDGETGFIRVVRRSAAGVWTDDPAAVAVKSVGGLAVGTPGGMEVVAYVPLSRRGLEAFDELGTRYSTPETEERLRPAFIRVGSGPSEGWAVVSILAPGTEDGVVEIREFRVGVGFEDPVVVRVLAPPARTVPGIEPPSPYTLDLDRVDLTCSTSSPSLAAAVFPADGGQRMQILAEARTWSVLPAFASIPIGAGPAGIELDAERASRPVLLSPSYLGGFSTAVFEDGREGPVLLLYGRRGGTAPTINPDEVAFSYKRSD